MRNALAHAGKSGRRVVSAFVATAFAQEDAEAAKLQWRKVADQLRPKLPKLAGYPDARAWRSRRRSYTTAWDTIQSPPRGRNVAARPAPVPHVARRLVLAAHRPRGRCPTRRQSPSAARASGSGGGIRPGRLRLARPRPRAVPDLAVINED